MKTGKPPRGRFQMTASSWQRPGQLQRGWHSGEVGARTPDCCRVQAGDEDGRTVRSSCHRNRIMKVFVGCVLLACVVVSSAVQFKDCSSPYAKANNVTISGCEDNVEVCELPKNTSVDFNMTFTPFGLSPPLLAVLTDENGLLIRFKNYDFCSSVDCPVQNNKPNNFTNSFTLVFDYPPEPVTANFKLKDDTFRDILCITFDFKIKG